MLTSLVRSLLTIACLNAFYMVVRVNWLASFPKIKIEMIHPSIWMIWPQSYLADSILPISISFSSAVPPLPRDAGVISLGRSIDLWRFCIFASAFRTSSSPLVNSLCLIIKTLTTTAKAAKLALSKNTALKPRVYPCQRMWLAVEGDIPLDPRTDDEDAGLNRDGSSTMVLMASEERDSAAMLVLRELLLYFSRSKHMSHLLTSI